MILQWVSDLTCLCLSACLTQVITGLHEKTVWEQNPQHMHSEPGQQAIIRSGSTCWILAAPPLPAHWGAVTPRKKKVVCVPELSTRKDYYFKLLFLLRNGLRYGPNVLQWECSPGGNQMTELCIMSFRVCGLDEMHQNVTCLCCYVLWQPLRVTTAWAKQRKSEGLEKYRIILLTDADTSITFKLIMKKQSINKNGLSPLEFD